MSQGKSSKVITLDIEKQSWFLAFFDNFTKNGCPLIAFLFQKDTTVSSVLLKKPIFNSRLDLGSKIAFLDDMK